MSIGWRQQAADQVGYMGIPPSPATDVGSELDWRARNLGSEKIIATYADLEYHFPHVGGLHIINTGARLTATIVMPNDRRILVAGGYLAGTFGVKHAIVGSYAGPLISGDPLLLSAIAIVQTNPGGVAIDGTSTTGAATVLRNVVITSPISPTPLCPAGSLHDLGALVIEGIQIDAMTAGLTLDGQVFAVRAQSTNITKMAPGAIAYTIGPTAVVIRGVGIQDSIYLTTDSDQRIVRIDPAATVPNPTAAVPTDLVGMRITGNSVAFDGAFGRVMDETGMDEKDIRVLAANNLYGGRSEFSGLATFSDTTPIVKTYGGTTFEPIPVGNGAVDITLDSTSQRFTFVNNGGTNHYLRYDGPLPNQVQRVAGGVSFEAASTASTLRVRLEWRATAVGAWTPVPGSVVRTRQVNGTPLAVSFEGNVIATPNHHYRITIANDNAAASTEITNVEIKAAGGI